VTKNAGVLFTKFCLAESNLVLSNILINLLEVRRFKCPVSSIEFPAAIIQHSAKMYTASER